MAESSKRPSLGIRIAFLIRKIQRVCVVRADGETRFMQPYHSAQPFYVNSLVKSRLRKFFRLAIFAVYGLVH